MGPTYREIWLVVSENKPDWMGTDIFLTREGTWTHDIKAAAQFLDSEMATEFCLSCQAPDETHGEPEVHQFLCILELKRIV